MNRTIAEIIFSGIIGDAAGYTLNGMKKKHIKAVFKDINGYTDPTAALKDNMQKWKKPGLYSSITQNILFTAACADKKGFNYEEYIKVVKNSPEVSGADYGIFRDPGEAEKNFIFRVKNGENPGHLYSSPCSRLLPPVLPFLFISNEKEHLISVVKYISLFTRNSSTVAGSIMFLQLIKDLIDEKETGILKTAQLSAEKAKNEIINNQQRIFDSGYNPDYIISDSDSLIQLFNKLADKNPDDSEKIICAHADKNGSIARGSINLPETILPMAVVLSDSCTDPEKIFYIAAREGGSASSLTSLSSIITAAFHGIHIPEDLIDKLVNKKRIRAIIDLIPEDRNRHSIITEIYSAEPGLTLKELEEHRAKNKNTHIPREKKKKTRSDTESELARHVVESWTKLDKAKWKKERKKENS